MGDERSNERQKGMMGSKQERKRDNGKWKDVIENNGRRKVWNNEK